MISKAFSRSMGAAVSAVMLAFSVPFTASAADQQIRGTIGGFDYEMWNQNYTGTVEFEPAQASFTCSWENVEDCFITMGKNYDVQKLNYRSIMNLSFAYDVDFTPKDNAYFGAYGWTRNPLMEYYIIEGWGSWRPNPSPNDKSYGTAVVNGNEYEVFTTTRYNQPSLEGTRTFPQYWSVRTESASRCNDTNHISGKIDIAKHFASWNAMGLDTSGTLYDAEFFVEGYRSSGSAELKSLFFGGGHDSSPVNINSKYVSKNILRTPDDDGYYIKNDFNEEYGEWESYGNCLFELTEMENNDTNCLRVYRRSEPWNGPSIYLGSKTFIPGETYSFGASVMQNTFPSEEIYLILQYTTQSDVTNYRVIDSATAKCGEWAKLSRPFYKLEIPEGSRDLTFFIDSAEECCDIYIDDFFIGVKGLKSFSDSSSLYSSELLGDINCDGAVDVFDLAPFRRGILSMIVSGSAAPANSDINGDGSVNVADLVLLQRYLLGVEKLPESASATTTASTTTTTTTTTVADDITTTTTSASTTSQTTEKETSATASQSTTTAPAASTTTTAAAAEKESYEFKAQYVNTSGKYDDTYPMTRIITSRDELESYMSEYMGSLKIEPLFSNIYDSETFLKNVENYTDEWFGSNKLVVVFLRETFLAPDTYKAAYINKDEVGIERLKNGGDMAISYWHIFIEVDKDAEIDDDFKVSVTNSPDMDLRYPFG